MSRTNRQCRLLVAGGMGKREFGVTARAFNITSFLNDENVLKVDTGDSRTMVLY